MRQIINISLPQNMSIIVDNLVDKQNFASKSEFFRHLLRLYLETQTLKSLKSSSAQIAKGQGQMLNSLKDLR